jgi:NTP pyrophosphatase (non-canonical NTP hydrolase)
MTIDEYAAWAATLGKQPLSADAEMLSYLGLGLAGEAGEVADRLKKFLRDGEWDAEGLAEELGDVIYFWACLCLCAGRKPSQVLAASRRKIETRAAVSRTSERSERRSGTQE